MALDPDRLLPLEGRARGLAQALLKSVEALPIVSPHGHCDPRWFADNAAFPDPAQLFVTPDHYVFRMLHSQGVALEDLGVPRSDGGEVETDARKIWTLFASNYHLFRATPSQMWIDHALQEVFGFMDPLGAATADAAFDHIADCLSQDAFRPRALFDRFNVEALATTEGALEPLEAHAAINASDWDGRVITTYRPDAVVDPEMEGFALNIEKLGEITRQDVSTWAGYLKAHRIRRKFFKSMGATASDHGHPTARTEDFDPFTASKLYHKALAGICTPDEADAFRGQMLTEMAKMSLDDGLVLQIHPGSWRNHSNPAFGRFGRDKGFDIPRRTDFVGDLRPLLSGYGSDTRLSVIIFTLDEGTYARELAPLAGVYPALKLGPPWWFYDSPEGMRRFREAATETAGFYNTVGFNDDTRAFCSIPARHDVARRVDCAYLANLVCSGRLTEADAYALAPELAHGLAKRAYNL